MSAVGVNRDFSLAHYPPGANAFEVAYMHRPWPHGYPLQSDDKGRLMKPWIPANLRVPEPPVVDKADAYRLKRNARRRVARAAKKDAVSGSPA